MWRTITGSLAIVAICATPFIALALQHEDSIAISGAWISHEGGEISFHPCGENICGTVSKLRPEDRANPPLDVNNPDPALRNRQLLGLTMFTGYKYRGKGKWTGGTIYNSDDGNDYRSKLRLKDDGTLKVSGCIFFFCRSFKWIRPGTATAQNSE